MQNKKPRHDRLPAIAKAFRLGLEQERLLYRLADYYYVRPWNRLTLAIQQLDDVPRDYQARPAQESQLLNYLLAPTKTHQFMLLHGAGGVGKTQLANMVGRSQEVAEYFVGGILFVQVGLEVKPLRNYLKHWLELMGETLLPSLPPHVLYQHLQVALGKNPVLVIIDDAQQVEQTTLFKLPQVNACYMVTSRESDLQFQLELPFCRDISIPPLTQAEGRQWLQKFLSEGPAPAHPTWLDEAADLCQGLPLALEVVTQGIKKFGWDKFRADVELIRRYLARLGLDQPNSPLHSLSLAYFIAYQALSPELQGYLAALIGVAAPPANAPQLISVDLAGQIWRTNRSKTEEVLRQLATHFWLHQVEPDTYALQAGTSTLLSILANTSPLIPLWKRYLDTMIPILKAWENKGAAAPRTLALSQVTSRPKATLEDVEGSWLERLAILRLTAHLAQQGQLSRALFMRVYLTVIDYMGAFYPEAGVVWARQAYNLVHSDAGLEKAVAAHLYAWMLQRTGGKEEEYQGVVQSALQVYSYTGDIYGELACFLQVNPAQNPEHISTLTRLLSIFIDRADLQLNDAHLLLHIGRYLPGAEHQQLATQCIETAQQIYQRQGETLNEQFLQRIIGKETVFLSAEEEERYLIWARSVEDAPFRHVTAWQKLSQYYQEVTPRRIEISDHIKLGERLKQGVFAERYFSAQWLEPGAQEAQIFRAIQNYNYSHDFEPRIEPSQSLKWLQLLQLDFYKRALSSPAALRQALEQRRTSLQTPGQNEPGVSYQLARQEVLAQVSDQERIEHHLASIRLTEAAGEAVEVAQLEQLLVMLEQLSPDLDRRLAALIWRIETWFERESGARVVVLTQYEETLRYLEESLKREISQHRSMPLFTLPPHLDADEQQTRLQAFAQAAPGLLLATDDLAATLDLQRVSHIVINYEVPWHPEWMEQRLQRFDRFGQTADTLYFDTLVMRDTLEEAVYKAWLHPSEFGERERQMLASYPPLHKQIKSCLAKATDWRREILLLG